MIHLNHTVSSYSITTSLAESSSSFTDAQQKMLDSVTKGKHVIVFSGYSDLGYNDLVSLKEQFNKILDHASEKFGIGHLAVVAGATPEGIGMVYGLAKERDTQTIGIVSEHAKEQSTISPHCDQVFYIADPEQSWKVLDKAGHSYMTYVATTNTEIARTGEFLALGRGDITVSELKEAKELGIETKIYPNFEPSSQKAAKRKENNPDIDLTPVKTFTSQLLQESTQSLHY